MTPNLSLHDPAIVGVAGAGGCTPSGELGNANSGSQDPVTCKRNEYSLYTSLSGLTANLSFNRCSMRWAVVASGAVGSITYQAMYDTSGDLVGSGQQDGYNMAVNVTFYSTTDEFCTEDATIRHAFVNTSTSCSDAGAKKCGQSGLDSSRGAYYNPVDNNQLTSTWRGGYSDGTTLGTSCSFLHTDA